MTHSCGHGPPYTHFVGVLMGEKYEVDSCDNCKKLSLDSGRNCLEGFEVVQ